MFPIGIWNQPPENFASWQKRGCNFVMGMDKGTTLKYSAKDFSQLAANAGLQVMLNTDFRAPNLLAWFVPIDEPNKVPVPIDQVKVWVDKFTALDNSLPIVISISGQRVTLPTEKPDYYQKLAALSPKVTLSPDWYCANTNPDRYLGMFMPEGLNGMSVRKLKEWCPQNKNWMFVECSFQGLSHSPDATPREPTADEMELQLKQGIAAGVEGMVYFATATGPNVPSNWPQNYDPPVNTEIPKRQLTIAQRMNPTPVVRYATWEELQAVQVQVTKLQNWKQQPL